MDYLVYAYLQLGQDAKAKAVLDNMSTVTGFTRNFPSRAVCARCFAGPLRSRARRRWKAAAELPGFAPARSRMYKRSRISRVRSARPVPAIPRPPRSTSPSSSNYETSCVMQKMVIGRNKLIFSGRSRAAWCTLRRGKRDDALNAMSALPPKC